MLALRLPALHPGQQQIAAQLRRFNVVRIGRRGGKTVLDLDYLLSPRNGCLAGLPVAFFAPSYKYLKDPWREATRLLRPLIRHKDEQEHRLELATGGLFEAWTLDGEDPARGRKYARVVVDEAAIVRQLEEKWDQSIRPTLTDYRGGAVLSSTPKGKNGFYRLDQRSKDRANWASFHAPSTVNPYLSKAEIAAAREDMPELVFRQEYLAEYVDFGGALVRAGWVRTGAASPEWPVALGVDLAISTKTTADYTAIVALARAPDGRVFVIGAQRFRETFHGILQRIAAAAQRYQPRAIIVESNAFQTSVVQELLRTTSLPVRGLRRDRDKLTAFGPVAARYEQGLIVHAPGLPREFAEELLAFTGTDDDDHDDFVDAMANAMLGLPHAGASVISAGRRESVDFLRLVS
jgi:predicted phage terminase large subunit-like protein